MAENPGLKLLNQFEQLGEIRYGFRFTDNPDERLIALNTSFPEVEDAPEKLREWARMLGPLANTLGVDPDPFAEVAASPYRFIDPSVGRAIEKLRARLTPTEIVEDLIPYDQVDDDGNPFREYHDERGNHVIDYKGIPVRLSELKPSPTEHSPAAGLPAPADNAGSEWLTVTQAAKKYSRTASQVSRAASRGDIKTNGETGRARRLEADELAAYGAAVAAVVETPDSSKASQYASNANEVLGSDAATRPANRKGKPGARRAPTWPSAAIESKH